MINRGTGILLYSIIDGTLRHSQLFFLMCISVLNILRSFTTLKEVYAPRRVIFDFSGLDYCSFMLLVFCLSIQIFLVLLGLLVNI